MKLFRNSSSYSERLWPDSFEFSHGTHSRMRRIAVLKRCYSLEVESWLQTKLFSHFRRRFRSSSSIGTTTLSLVLACSTVVEHSQQEGFYRMLLPAARQTPNLEDQWLERSNSPHKAPPASETTRETPAAEGGNMGENWPRILPKVATSASLLGSFTCHNFTTWDRRLNFPSEGRRAEDFFATLTSCVWYFMTKYTCPFKMCVLQVQ